MAVRGASDSEPKRSRLRPATTPEGRENQLVSLAVDLAEQQLRDGTASAQVISQLLKWGSSREKLEQERIAHENHLLEVKAEAIASAQNMEELYLSAMNAMTAYSGNEPTAPAEEYDG